jgi:hypothetical protein
MPSYSIKSPLRSGLPAVAHKLLTFLTALAAIVFAMHSLARADSCSHAFGHQGGTGCNSVIATAPSLPTLTYIGSATPTYAGNVATATGANIGTAASNRLVVVVFFDMADGANSTASVTIGGSAATVDTMANSTFNPVQGIASLNVPAGTTATIVVTYGAAGGNGNFQIYTITGLSSFAHVGANSNWNGGLNPISTTIATSAGGVIITGATQNITPSGTTTSFSGTETYAMDQTDIDVGSIGTGAAGVGRATGTSANASSTVTATWNTGSNHSAISAVSWR